jgi:hypothetical protein
MTLSTRWAISRVRQLSLHFTTKAHRSDPVGLHFAQCCYGSSIVGHHTPALATVQRWYMLSGYNAVHSTMPARCCCARTSTLLLRSYQHVVAALVPGSGTTRSTLKLNESFSPRCYISTTMTSFRPVLLGSRDPSTARKLWSYLYIHTYSFNKCI